MALKGQKTTTGFIPWDNLMQLILKLQRDKEYKFCLLIATGCFTGLRISDIQNLTWENILNQDFIGLTEKKTKKYRKIKINSDLKEIISKCYIAMKSPPLNTFLLVNKFGTQPIRIQWINEKLKLIFSEHKIKATNASSHTLRKTFGRKIWELNNYSDKSLILLSEIFNHSGVQVTKKYLGIREEEINDVYDMLGM